MGLIPFGLMDECVNVLENIVAPFPDDLTVPGWSYGFGERKGTFYCFTDPSRLAFWRAGLGVVCGGAG